MAAQQHLYSKTLLEGALILSGFDRCRLFLHENGSGYLVHKKTAGEPYDKPSMTATLPADGPLLQELARRGRPLLATAGGRDDWVGGDGWLVEGSPGGDNLAALVIVPLLADSEMVGMIVLERRTPAPITDRLQDQLMAYARLAAAGLSNLQDSGELAARHDELLQRHQNLVTVQSVERRLSVIASSGGGLSGIVDACRELTGKVLVVFDDNERLLTPVAPPGPGTVEIPPILAILAAVDLMSATPAEPLIVPARPADGLQRRHLIAAVVNAGDRLGWIVMAEHPSRLRTFDEFVVLRAAEHIGRELTVIKRVTTASWNARSALTRQLVRATSNPDDLRSSGEYLGVNINARRVLAYVRARSNSDGFIDDALMADKMQRRLGVEVLATRGSEGVILLIEAPADLSAVAAVRSAKRTIDDLCRTEFSDVDLVVGVSSATEPSGLSRAYREAREVALCIDRLAKRSSPRVLAVDDLGPARLFIANSAVASIRSYVNDVLGALLTGTSAMTDLLLTLQMYFDADRSIRTSAAWLGVHENTIRLRLARVQSITGLDTLGDSNDQLSIQTALLVLRLQGHPALLRFGESRRPPPGSPPMTASVITKMELNGEKMS